MGWLCLSCTTEPGQQADPEPPGGQTGDEGESYFARTSGVGNRACDFDESVFDEAAPTRYGVSLDEALAAFEQPEQQSFFWRPFRDEDFELQPGVGRRELFLSVARREGTVFEIRDKDWEGQEAGRCNTLEARGRPARIPSFLHPTATCRGL